jgi:hypothetical protein
MKRIAKYFLGALILVALAIFAWNLFQFIMHPIRAAQAEGLADEAVRKRGSFQKVLFDDLGNERYRAVYKSRSRGRVDVIVDNGQLTIQEGLPTGGMYDLTP